jgi:hypothetical protein
VTDDVPEDGDLATALLQGHDIIEQTAAAHRERWGLGTADGWQLDQVSGMIAWYFADDRIASAPAQVLGSFRGGDRPSFQWGWDNPHVLPALRRDAERVREWGAAHGHRALTRGVVPATEEEAADLAAIGVRVSGATGFYRAPGEVTVYLTFGEVTIDLPDGSSEIFIVEVSG